MLMKLIPLEIAQEKNDKKQKESQTKTARCFQRHFKAKQVIPREVTPHLQPSRVLFHRAIQL